MKGLGRKQPTVEKEAQATRDYLQQFDAIAILDGQLVSGVMLAGAATLDVAHSLGRVYRGGLIAGVSAAAAVQVQTARAAGASLNAAKALRIVAPAALGADTTISVWVF